MLDRIEAIHKIGYLHNDIKLENIVVGNHDPETAYLIDFGLATRWLEKDGSHCSKQRSNRFSGNLMFASINACRGYTKSRRDDIECLFYLIAYLLNNNKLPWSDSFDNMREDQLREMLKERTSLRSVQQIFSIPGLENTFVSNFKHVLILKFDDSPNYAGIRQCLSYCFVQCIDGGDKKSLHNFSEQESTPRSNTSQMKTHKFEWMVNFADKKMERELKKSSESRLSEAQRMDNRFMNEEQRARLQLNSFEINSSYNSATSSQDS